MKNSWMLAAANLKKSKSQAVSLLIFVGIATLLLDVGLVVFSGVGEWFDRRAEELHAPHAVVFYTADADASPALAYFENYPGVTETETLDAVGGMGSYSSGGKNPTALLFFFRADAEQKMDAPVLMGESLPLEGDAIYLPNFIRENGGAALGEEFRVSMFGTDLRFLVAGWTEEITMGALMNTVYRLYVSDETFDAIVEKMPDGRTVMLAARLENKEDAARLFADYNRDMNKEGVLFSMSLDSARMARITMSTVIAVFIAAFAVVLVCVCLVVLHFRIINSIAETMVNIGVLKAAGYRSTQIVSAMVMQFGIIALAGGLLGILLAQALLPVTAVILRPQMALDWKPGFEPATALLSILFVLSMVLLTAFLAARKVKKLHPLVALRGGITTHSFRKNAFPLEKTRGPLSLSLALKQIAKNKKQAAMTGLIMAAVAVTMVIGITMHFSMNVNREQFARSFFGELADAHFVLTDKIHGDAFLAHVESRPEVRKVLGFQNGDVTLQIDGTQNVPIVTKDCSLLEGSLLLEGGCPRHKNEIALGSIAARTLNKDVGDMVTVEYGGNGTKKQYIITGIVQYINNGGFNGIITADGLRELDPAFAFSAYNVYLKEGADIGAFVEAVKKTKSSILESAGNNHEQIDTMLGSIGGILAIVAAGIAAVSILVVMLTLHLLIKTILIRRRREMGIQKALGFTTVWLMHQIFLNLAPSAIIGVIAGSAAGCILINPLVAIMMSSLGIVKASLPLPAGWIAAAGAALVCITYVLSMLMTLRIRKISACALVSE